MLVKCVRDIFNLLSDPVPDYVKACVETVMKIYNREPSGDVLVFLTGHDEVETAVRLLKEFTFNNTDSNRKGQLSVIY